MQNLNPFQTHIQNPSPFPVAGIADMAVTAEVKAITTEGMAGITEDIVDTIAPTVVDTALYNTRPTTSTTISK